MPFVCLFAGQLALLDEGSEALALLGIAPHHVRVDAQRERRIGVPELPRDVDGAHRILRQGGHISDAWHRTGGGPEQCLRLLRAEGAWDDAHGRARKDRYLDAAALRPHL